MLKFDSIHLLKAIVHLFNTIISNGNFLQKWDKNIITPVHKSGDVNDPNNYSIAVGSSLAKPFTKILSNRIYNYLNEKNFWKENQSGFRKGRRTHDNIFYPPHFIPKIREEQEKQNT